MISKIKKKGFIKQTLTENGITLIALVITIVVLLILASVSITAVFGDNGILQLAKEAGEKTNEAVKDDKEQIEEMGDIINDYLEVPKTVEEAIKRNYKFKENTDIIDKYGNPITIPAGFRIVPNGTDFVEYNYDEDESGNKTHIPTVQDGIVIKDEENYFVWIPIGEINNKAGEPTKIKLGRYTFSDDVNKKGEEQLEQEADEEKYTEPITILGHYQELENSEVNNQIYANPKAKNLGTFIAKTKEKRGYYIARYETVKGKDEKAKSKPSTVASAMTDDQEIKEGMVWANINPIEASKMAQTMYNENSNFETDLINSYEWDTAIVFIQKYSGDTDYSKQSAVNEEGPSYTGERTPATHNEILASTTDKVCNIYDMASNLREFSTETSNYDNLPCMRRGARFGASDDYSSSRNACGIDTTLKSYSFRIALYLTK